LALVVFCDKFDFWKFLPAGCAVKKSKKIAIFQEKRYNFVNSNINHAELSGDAQAADPRAALVFLAQP
jgi:hypothetical protein